MYWRYWKTGVLCAVPSTLPSTFLFLVVEKLIGIPKAAIIASSEPSGKSIFISCFSDFVLAVALLDFPPLFEFEFFDVSTFCFFLSGDWYDSF